MTAKQTKAVAKASEGQVPEFMKKSIGNGAELIDSEDLEIPRLKLLQALSPEVQEGDQKAGEFFHTLLEEALSDGKTPLRVVPVFYQKKFILWKPQHEGGGILARAEDGKNWSPNSGSFDVTPVKGGKSVKYTLAPTVRASGLANWGSSNPEDPNSAPAAPAMFCYVVAFPDLPNAPMAVLTLQRSSEKIAKKLNSKLKFGDGVPMYGMAFELTTINDQNSAGQSFKNFKISPAGFLQDEELFSKYEETHNSLKASGFKVEDTESVQGEESEVEDSNDGTPEM